MNNLLYKIIESATKHNFPSLLFTAYTILNKEDKNYYILDPKEKKTGGFLIENIFFNVSDYHISIYENLREIDQNAAFHITVEIKKEKDTTDEKVFARAFFDGNGNFLFLNVKDQ